MACWRGVAGANTNLASSTIPTTTRYHTRRGWAHLQREALNSAERRDLRRVAWRRFFGRTSAGGIKRLVPAIIDAGGIFYRNASGALSLAYVAAGKLLGYVEEHMNAWDCLAGQLMVAEAGGVVEDQDASDMVARGGRVIVATPEAWDEVLAISEAAYAPGQG